MKKTVGIAALCCCLGLCGCATLVDGHYERVSFYSDPQGGEVVVGGKIMCKTPCSALVRKQNAAQTVTIQLSGYVPYKEDLNVTISPWIWGNIFTGLVPGMVVDYLSEGMYRLSDRVAHRFSEQEKIKNETSKLAH